MIRFIIYLFGVLLKDREKEQAEIERGIVTRYAYGDWRLQMGKYLTEKDIVAMKRAVTRYKF